MTYQPVPVEVARQIALKFDKSMVIILSHDPEHGLLHTTTYGVGAKDKHQAAALGELVTVACGGDLAQREVFSDFRLRPATVSAQQIDQLLIACEAGDQALAMLLGVRDRFSHEMVAMAEAARAAIARAVAAADALEATNGGAAEGDTQG